MRITLVLLLSFLLGAATAFGAEIRFSPDVLPNASVGSLYSQTIEISCSADMEEPVEMELLLPLPPQLRHTEVRLGSDGRSGYFRIYGLPTLSGSFILPIKVSDSGDVNFGVKEYRLLVQSGPNALRLEPNSLPRGEVGKTYRVDFLASGGVPPYEFYLKGEAVGEHSYLSSDGRWSFSFTPKEAGYERLEVEVTDSSGQRLSRYYDLKVEGADLVGGGGCSSMDGGHLFILLAMAIVLWRGRSDGCGPLS